MPELALCRRLWPLLLFLCSDAKPLLFPARLVTLFALQQLIHSSTRPDAGTKTTSPSAIAGSLSHMEGEQNP